MLYENLFKNPKDAAEILGKIEHCSDGSGQIRLMEICGTHTMAIARSGIRSVLPASVRLLSGPSEPPGTGSSGGVGLLSGGCSASCRSTS